MSLEHILLGLCREPRSGYDLKRYFDVAIRYFWPAELSQVYPALHRLEKRGLLRSSMAPPRRGPRRRLYATTGKGQVALRRWLEAGPAFRDERYVFAAQVFLLDALEDLDKSSAFVERLRAELERRRRALEATEAEEPQGDPALAESSWDFHNYLCLRMGLRVLEARIAWCDEALEMIRRRKSARKE